MEEVFSCNCLDGPHRRGVLSCILDSDRIVTQADPNRGPRGCSRGFRVGAGG